MLIHYIAPNIRAVHKKYCTAHSLLAARVTWHREYYIPKNYHTPPNKQVLGAFKPPTSVWHSRLLGHASLQVVQIILSRHKLSYSSDSSSSVICDACQRGKSHQLPYPKSNSVSSKPFELVFSVVWGPASTSVGRHSYYVSFIDDFSKYT
jgi:hypothetical protein